MNRALFLLATVATLVAVPAKADTFQYDRFSEVNAQTVTFTSPRSVTAGVGEIVLHGTGANANQTLVAWCIDIAHNLLGSSTYNIVPLTTAGSGSPNPPLTDTQISEMGSLMIHGAADLPGDLNFDASAAFQLAIWKVEYGGALSDNLLDGSALNVLANQFVTNVSAGGIWECPGCSVMQLDATAGSNQVLAFGVAAVPGPIVGAGLPGVMFASGGLLAWWRKKRKGAAVVAA
jgi:hypothetical protein